MKKLESAKSKISIPEDKFIAFQDLVLRLKEVKAKGLEEEQDLYADAPEEFLDPMLYTIMKNPVTLPESKTVIDYMTIKKHLMNDPHDPFNRGPLKIEDCPVNTELKKRIEAWLEEKKQKRQGS